MSRVEISGRLVAINALSSVVARALNVGVLVWLNQYLLERLSADEYAPYPVVASVVLFLQILTTAITGGLARYVTEAYAKGDLYRVTEVVSSMMPVVLAGTLAFLGIGGLAAWNVGRILTIHPGQLDDARLMMALLVLMNAVVLLASPFSVGLHVRQRFVWLNLIQLGAEALRLTVLFTLLFGVSTRVLWVVVAALSAELVRTLMTVALSRRVIPALRFEAGAVQRATARELTSFGAWTMLGTLVYRIRTHLDVIILNKLSTAVDVTSYYIGMFPERQMTGFMSVASQTLQPALTAMHATSREESLRRSYLRGNRYYLWIALAVAVPLIAFSKELITLYVGTEYILAASVLVIISGRYPFMYASEMLYRVAMAKARIRAFFLLTSLSAVVKIALALLLVGYYGMGAIGAAYSSFFTGITFQLVVLWPLGLRMLELSFGSYVRKTLLPGYLPALVSIVVALVVDALFPAESWALLGAEVAFVLVVYGLVMRLCLQPEDYSVYERALGKLRRLVGRG